jgi:ubiquinone/menaquinone biosynthesis C-methylase UbiE
MPAEKSLFYYGSLFHWLFDRPLAEARQVVTDLVPAGSSVLDIGSGTGMLCAALREKNCRVIGLDLSLRMIRYAEKHNRYDDVRFVHGDATDLSEVADRSFDYATLVFLIHELPREAQLRALNEAVRVARNLVIVDSTVPLPKNLGARGQRFVEATFGRDHYRHFKAFLASGGILGVLEAAALPVAVGHRAVFWRNCREIVVASRVQ